MSHPKHPLKQLVELILQYGGSLLHAPACFSELTQAEAFIEELRALGVDSSNPQHCGGKWVVTVKVR